MTETQFTRAELRDALIFMLEFRVDAVNLGGVVDDALKVFAQALAAESAHALRRSVANANGSARYLLLMADALAEPVQAEQADDDVEQAVEPAVAS